MAGPKHSGCRLHDYLMERAEVIRHFVMPDKSWALIEAVKKLGTEANSREVTLILQELRCEFASVPKFFTASMTAREKCRVTFERA